MALPSTTGGYTEDDWFTQQGPVEEVVASPPPAPGEPRTPEQFEEAARRSAWGYGGGGAVPTGGGAGYTGNPKADWAALVAGRPASPQTIAEVFPQFAAWYPGSTYEKGDIKGPWGWADVIGGLDDPSQPPKWQWHSTYWQGAGGEGIDRRTPDGAAGAGGFGMLSGGMGSLADLAAGALTTSPGYKFRLQEGQKALERSAAARGTLLTGGTSKALTRYGQDYAANEYAANYARLFGEQNARYNQLYGLSSLGLNAAGQSALLGSSYAGQAGNLGQNYANQVGNLGQNYAGQAGSLYASQAGAGSDLATQAANAAAAGTIGGANAGTQAASGISNAVQQALLLWYLNQNRTPTPGQP